MIELKKVTKSYVSGKNAVDHLELTVKDGEIFGFLGPNGAGKTTTIKMLTGILKPTEGKILISGKDIEKEAIEAKKNFGYVPDSPEMFLRLRGMEYLNFIADMYDMDSRERKEIVEELAQKFEMQGNLNNKISEYSHGMKQKIFIMGVLMHQPKNWIMDEPMTGLDPKASHLLKELMREHANKGSTVFFSTHVLEVAEKICDRIGIINNGKLITVGTVEEIKKQFCGNESLENIFLEITENEKNI